MAPRVPSQEDAFHRSLLACTEKILTFQVILGLTPLLADEAVTGSAGASSSASAPKSRFGYGSSGSSSSSMFRGQGQKAASSSSRPGRFLRSCDVVMYDPTGVLEQLWQSGREPNSSSSSGGNSTAAGKAKAKEVLGPVSLPRVLEAHYPAKVRVPGCVAGLAQHWILCWRTNATIAMQLRQRHCSVVAPPHASWPVLVLPA